MGTMAFQITSHMIVYSTVYSGADQRKHQSSASLTFVGGIHKGPVTRKKFPFDDCIVFYSIYANNMQWNWNLKEQFSYKKTNLEMSHTKLWQYCVGLDVSIIQ